MPRRRPADAAGKRASRGADPYHHGDLPRALLAAAEQVLEESGVDGFTLRECARRAGVSHGAPAHHFGDVRGLLTEFTAASFEQMVEAMQRQRRRAAADAQSQLIAVGAGYVEYALAHRARFQLMFRSDRLDHGNARLQAASAAAYAQLVETMTATAAAAGAAGHLLQEKIVLAWVVVHGFATLMLDNVLFASQAGAVAGGTQALLRRLLLMCQPGFALRDAPGG